MAVTKTMRIGGRLVEVSGIDRDQLVDRLTYEFRQTFECKVCCNTPNDDGEIEHGRGCYVVDSDGGGSTYVENTDRAAIEWMLERFPQIKDSQ